MLLFFHKELTDAGPQFLTSSFSRLDQIVYVSTVVEEDDDLSQYSQVELRCRSGNTLLAACSWNMDETAQLYSMWFDLARITNLNNFDILPITAELLLDDSVVLMKDASIVVDLNYARIRSTGGNGYGR